MRSIFTTPQSDQIGVKGNLFSLPLYQILTYSHTIICVGKPSEYALSGCKHIIFSIESADPSKKLYYFNVSAMV